MFLHFDGGYLCPLKPADVHRGYIAGLNDPEVNRYLEVRFAKQTMTNVRKFVRNNERSPNAVLWGVWQLGKQHHVGTVRVHGIEGVHRTAHVGVCIFDRAAWGQHVGRRAVITVTRWGFEALQLRWLEAGIYANNLASERMFVSAGYRFVSEISGKYLLEGAPTKFKIFAACA
jgi:RimJ/RimL family protein N-acetyltransferase